MSLFDNILHFNHLFFKSLPYLNTYISKYKRSYLLGFLFILIKNVLSIIPVIYIGKAINEIEKALTKTVDSSQSILYNLTFYGGMIIFAPALSGLFEFFMRQTIIVASRKIEFDLKNEIFKHYEMLSQAFYKKNKTGDLISRISEDISQTRMYLGPGIMYVLNLFSITLLVTYQIIAINAHIAVFILIPLLTLSLSIFLISRAMNAKSRRVQQQLSVLSSFVQDIFSGIRIIKTYQMEKQAIKEYNEKTSEYRKKNLAMISVNAFFFPMIIVIVGLSYLLILYVGGVKYANGEIKDIGMIAQFLMYTNLLIWPFTASGWVTSVIQRAEAAQKRINKFLCRNAEIKNYNHNPLDIKGAIEFKNVSFTYDNTGVHALKDISFKIGAGKTLAILGKTGAGKTTIGELINRMYDTNSGKILIDGRDIRALNLYSLRSQIGYVPQEAFLFSDTIRNNIKFGLDATETDEKEMIASAKNAAVHENIIHFQKGYDTPLGERGVTLSGGQKQRISIARALIKKPKVYIFDDSLSAVDTETEEAILKNLDRSTKSATNLIITHRISSAKNADYIIVLDHGKIVEEGTHEVLAKKEGYYHNLYLKQFST